MHGPPLVALPQVCDAEHTEHIAPPVPQALFVVPD
jgi:hypothetical protein